MKALREHTKLLERSDQATPQQVTQDVSSRVTSDELKKQRGSSKSQLDRQTALRVAGSQLVSPLQPSIDPKPFDAYQVHHQRNQKAQSSLAKPTLAKIEHLSSRVSLLSSD